MSVARRFGWRKAPMDAGLMREMDVEVHKEVAAIEALIAADLQQAGQTLQDPKTWQPARGKDPFATCFDRRAFLRGGAAGLSALALSWPLQELMKRQAYGATILVLLLTGVVAGCVVLRRRQARG